MRIAGAKSTDDDDEKDDDDDDHVTDNDGRSIERYL